MHLIWTMIWKEWLGLRWKLAALGAIPLGMLAAVLMYDATFIAQGLVSVVIGYGAVAPIFLAMHATAEERSSGTLDFVRGLPVSLVQLGLVRVLATLAVLLAPLIVTGVIVYGVASFLSWCNPETHFEMGVRGLALGPAIALFIASGMTVTASLYLWTTALAMNQPSELRAGVIGIANLVVWGAFTILIVAQSENSSANSILLQVITALGPFATLIIFDPRTPTNGLITIGTMQLAMACVLVTIAACRYGILERRRWMGGLQLSNPNRALWWMQWRQARPLAVAGLAIVFIFGAALAQRSRNEFYDLSIYFGGVWAIVVGATMFSGDLEPHLVAFWRSRPIDPSAWFRTRYLTGAISVLICFGLPMIWLAHIHYAFRTDDFLAYMVCLPSLHLAVYSLTVAISCLVRQVVYAGILSMAATLFLVVLPMIVPKRGLLSAIDIEALIYPDAGESIAVNPSNWLLRLAVYLAFTLLVTIIATAVAHWAVQKDIAVRA